MRHRSPLIGQLAPLRLVDDLLGHGRLRLCSGGLFAVLVAGGVERLNALGVVTVNGNGLQAQTPTLNVGVHGLFYCRLFRHVDGLRNCAGNERLHRRHHAHVAHVMNRPLAVLRTEAAIEHREMLVLHPRRAFDGARGIDIGDDLIHLLGRITQLDERLRNRVIHDADHAAAHQLLELHQCEIGLDAGGVAIHHEADGAGRSDHRGLRVAETGLFAERVGIVPDLLGGLIQSLWHALIIERLHGVAMIANHFEEGLFIHRVARTRPHGFGNARAGEISLAAHHRRDSASPVAPIR